MVKSNTTTSRKAGKPPAGSRAMENSKKESQHHPGGKKQSVLVDVHADPDADIDGIQQLFEEDITQTDGGASARVGIRVGHVLPNDKDTGGVGVGSGEGVGATLLSLLSIIIRPINR